MQKTKVNSSLRRLATLLSFVATAGLYVGSASAQNGPPTECIGKGDCDDQNPDTADFCQNGSCQHVDGITLCEAEGTPSCEYPDGVTAPVRDFSTDCAAFGIPGLTGFPGDSFAAFCFNGKCMQAYEGNVQCNPECSTDSECDDGNHGTINWCNAGQCEQVEREDWNCYDSHGPFICWSDSHCNDGDANTVNWCNAYAECNSTPRTNTTGACSAQPQSCYFNWECRDGDSNTKTWCHEGTCRTIQKDDPTCSTQDIGCNRNSDCRVREDLRDQYVSWCHEGDCRLAPRDATATCSDSDSVLGNIKPAY